MMAKCVAPSRVMVLTRNAPGGTSPWSPPASLAFATRAAGFQLIGQNGLLVAASTLKEDLFFTEIGVASSIGFLTSAGGGCSSGLFLSAAGAAFSAAANRNDAAKIDMQIRVKDFIIAFE